jgi:heme/copper-type cytochrome/quinol oxidase subunit 2
MKSFTSIIKNMAGLSYITMITMFILSAITFSGLHAVTATREEDSNVIQLGIVQQQEEVYRWSNDSGAINPTLKFIVNRDNIVKIQNPTDEEHEMIVQSQPGNELAASQDIEPNSSGELSFRPNITGTFQYHCEYHPTTMRGIIEVIDE